MTAPTSSPSSAFSARARRTLSTSEDTSSGVFTPAAVSIFTIPGLSSSLNGSREGSSISESVLPIRRFALEIVFRGSDDASSSALRPTSADPSGRYRTTEGRRSDPSSPGSTSGFPSLTVATREFVVPRSIPTARWTEWGISDMPGSAI